MKLRDYQQRALDQLYSWFSVNDSGNPVLAMPGGSGKSVVIASIVADALKSWPSTRVLMLVRSQELVAQNADKLKKIWPNAPMGIVCSSLGKRQWGEPIIYASPGSVANRVELLGHKDLVVIDEAHMVSAKDEGTYREILNKLWKVNPNMRVVGFSASPYRLGHGMITDGDEAIFSEIIEPVSIEELVFKGYLSPLKSKCTSTQLSPEGIKIRSGDFAQGEMQRAYNTEEKNSCIAEEISRIASDRKHWLIFCSGKEHARNVSEKLNEIGIKSDWIASPISKKDREAKIAAFESGEIRALCNVGILSTGYDFPALDCIAFLRSTMSPGRYLQEAVRGMRIHLGKTDCLVLDFAGVVRQHGPITAVQPPQKAGNGGEAPVKVCPECFEIVHASAKRCDCGHEFASDAPERKTLTLHNDDIMGLDNLEMAVSGWKWAPHTSQRSGKDMLKVTYYGDLSDKPVTEYVCIMHGGKVGAEALQTLRDIAQNSGANLADCDTLADVSHCLNDSRHPATIEYRKEGKFYRVIDRNYDAD